MLRPDSESKVQLPCLCSSNATCCERLLRSPCWNGLLSPLHSHSLLLSHLSPPYCLPICCPLQVISAPPHTCPTPALANSFKSRVDLSHCEPVPSHSACAQQAHNVCWLQLPAEWCFRNRPTAQCRPLTSAINHLTLSLLLTVLITSCFSTISEKKEEWLFLLYELALTSGVLRCAQHRSPGPGWWKEPT